MLIGHVIATQVVAFPIFGIHIALDDDLAIGMVFLTGPQFTLRRIFEAI